MMRLSVVLLMAVGCASVPTPVAERTLPTPFESSIPDEPPRPEGGIHTVAVEASQDADGAEVGPGVLFDMETAAYVARLRVGYDEIRQLYVIDSRTRDREREIYESALGQSDSEIQRQAALAERSWWEKHGGVVALVAGIVIGVVATIGVLAATEEVRSGP